MADRRPDDNTRVVDVGRGRPLLLCPGFALDASAYDATIDDLVRRCRVIVPDLYGGAGPWTFERMVDNVERALDRAGVDKVSVVAHSFGGAAALGLACRTPARVVDLVLSDTLGVSTRWHLAASAARALPQLWQMASVAAIRAFARAWRHYPRQLCQAAWWGFSSSREPEIEIVRRLPMRKHVLWATRDTLVSKADGEQFAARLGADFTVVSRADGEPTHHDWVFRHAHLVLPALERAGVWAVEPESLRPAADY